MGKKILKTVDTILTNEQGVTEALTGYYIPINHIDKDNKPYAVALENGDVKLVETKTKVKEPIEVKTGTILPGTDIDCLSFENSKRPLVGFVNDLLGLSNTPDDRLIHESFENKHLQELVIALSPELVSEYLEESTDELEITVNIPMLSGSIKKKFTKSYLTANEQKRSNYNLVHYPALIEQINNGAWNNLPMPGVDGSCNVIKDYEPTQTTILGYSEIVCPVIKFEVSTAGRIAMVMKKDSVNNSLDSTIIPTQKLKHKGRLTFSCIPQFSRPELASAIGFGIASEGAIIPDVNPMGILGFMKPDSNGVWTVTIDTSDIDDFTGVFMGMQSLIPLNVGDWISINNLKIEYGPLLTYGLSSKQSLNSSNESPYTNYENYVKYQKVLRGNGSEVLPYIFHNTKNRYFESTRNVTGLFTKTEAFSNVLKQRLQFFSNTLKIYSGSVYTQPTHTVQQGIYPLSNYQDIFGVSKDVVNLISNPCYGLLSVNHPIAGSIETFNPEILPIICIEERKGLELYQNYSFVRFNISEVDTTSNVKFTFDNFYETLAFRDNTQINIEVSRTTTKGKDIIIRKKPNCNILAVNRNIPDAMFMTSPSHLGLNNVMRKFGFIFNPKFYKSNELYLQTITELQSEKVFDESVLNQNQHITDLDRNNLKNQTYISIFNTYSDITKIIEPGVGSYDKVVNVLLVNGLNYLATLDNFELKPTEGATVNMYSEQYITDLKVKDLFDNLTEKLKSKVETIKTRMYEITKFETITDIEHIKDIKISDATEI